MYSHDNLTYMSRVVVETYGWSKESVVSYLPLCHIAAMAFDVLCLIQSGGTMYCGDKNALKGTLVCLCPSPNQLSQKTSLSSFHSQVDNLKEVRPKKFLAVPRVYEKIVERLQEAERSSSPAKQMLMRWALAKGREHSELVLKHGPSQKGSLGYKLAHRLILRY